VPQESVDARHQGNLLLLFVDLLGAKFSEVRSRLLTEFRTLSAIQSSINSTLLGEESAHYSLRKGKCLYNLNWPIDYVEQWPEPAY
jgi:hypothetical protein